MAAGRPSQGSSHFPAPAAKSTSRADDHASLRFHPLAFVPVPAGRSGGVAGNASGTRRNADPRGVSARDRRAQPADHRSSATPSGWPSPNGSRSVPAPCPVWRSAVWRASCSRKRSASAFRSSTPTARDRPWSRRRWMRTSPSRWAPRHSTSRSSTRRFPPRSGAARRRFIAAQENLYTVAATQLHADAHRFPPGALPAGSSAKSSTTPTRSLAANIQSQNQLASAGLVGRQRCCRAGPAREFQHLPPRATGTSTRPSTSLLQSMGREPSVHGPDALARITLAGTLGNPCRRSIPPPPPATRSTADPTCAIFAPWSALPRRRQHRPGGLLSAGAPVPRRGSWSRKASCATTRTNAVRSSDQVQTTEIRPGVIGNWTIIDTGTVRGAVRGREAARDLLSISLAQAGTRHAGGPRGGPRAYRRRGEHDPPRCAATSAPRKIL